MTLKDLNEYQIHQLKERILSEQMVNPSQMELNYADELITYTQVEDTFGSVIFCEEDFY